VRWVRDVWTRLLPTARTGTADTTASTDSKIGALETHQARLLEALDRELELYRLSKPTRDHQ